MGKENKGGCKGGDDCLSDEHLCRIAKRGDAELIKRLAKDPRFICLKCGRKAHDAANLCRPEGI